MHKNVTTLIEQETLSNPIPEKVLERRTCTWSGEEFPVFERDKELLDQMRVEVGSELFDIPMPVASFRWRQFNRMLFRNERTLYKRICTETNASIISIYAPEYTGAVCTQEYRRSDARDPLAYGFAFDFSGRFNDQFKKLYDAVPKMATSIQESENCTFTNSTGDSKNCYMSFRCHYCEDALYSYRPNRSKGCVDCYQVKNCERLYECIVIGKNTSMDNYSGGDSELCYTTSATKKSYRTHFTLRVKSCTNVLYSMFCFNCNECFGCVGLRNKEFCVFNVQYTREEYNELVGKIIRRMQETGEWGLFFEPGVSAFPVNDTVAAEAFPLHKKTMSDGSHEIINDQGYGDILLSGDEMIAAAKLDTGNKQFDILRRTKETEVNIPATVDILRWTELPETIEEVDDSILKKIIVCSVSGRPYRIIPQELNFYREVGLPLPRVHPDMRHQKRAEQLAPRELNLRMCDKTHVEVLSVYPQDAEVHVVETELYGKILYG